MVAGVGVGINAVGGGGMKGTANGWPTKITSVAMQFAALSCKEVNPTLEAMAFSVSPGRTL
jgi:hypothetical protein